MVGIRAAAMGDPVAFDLTAGEVDDVEARFARRLREIDDADRSRGMRPVLDRAPPWHAGTACGSMPAGAVGAAGCTAGSGRAPADRGRRADRRSTEDPRARRRDSIAPLHANRAKTQHFPAIQRHHFPPLETNCIPVKRLIADNPLVFSCAPPSRRGHGSSQSGTIERDLIHGLRRCYGRASAGRLRRQWTLASELTSAANGADSRCSRA